MNLYKFLKPFDYDQKLTLIYEVYTKDITKAALFDRMNSGALKLFRVDTAWTRDNRLCIYLNNPYDEIHTEEIIGMLEYWLGDKYD